MPSSLTHDHNRTQRHNAAGSRRRTVTSQTTATRLTSQLSTAAGLTEPRLSAAGDPAARRPPAPGTPAADLGLQAPPTTQRGRILVADARIKLLEAELGAP